MNKSRNVNTIIRADLKSLFFYGKILHAQKAQKEQKVQRHNQAKAQKVKKNTKMKIGNK